MIGIETLLAGPRERQRRVRGSDTAVGGGGEGGSAPLAGLAAGRVHQEAAAVQSRGECR